MGLQDGHPEKEGVLVDLKNMAQEVKVRLQRKKELDNVTRQAEGLRVVHGIKGDEVKTDETPAEPKAAEKPIDVEEVTPAPAN